MEIKKYNSLRVFQVVRKHSPIARKDIENLTGLSWGSVYSICNDFLEQGLFVTQRNSSVNGRPHEKFAVTQARKLSLGIDINSVGLSFNLVDLSGKTVYSLFIQQQDKKKESLLTLLEQQTADILKKFDDIIGINISMQGKINKLQGISVRTNFFENWKNVPIVDFFTQRFNLPTMLYHDPDCLLTYHLQTDERLHAYSNGAIVRIDDGIGYAQLTGNHLYEPEEDETCELGHMIVVPNGNNCMCGKKGCLEEYASLRGMKSIFAKTNSGDFLEQLQKGNENAIEIVNQAANYFGIALSNLFTISVPSFILLDGIALMQIPNFFELIKSATEQFLGGKCNLIRAKHQVEAPSIGACILTIEKNIENIVFDD